MAVWLDETGFPNLREIHFFPENEITVTSQVRANYRKWRSAVSLIRWCLQWLSSSIRWDIMCDHLKSGPCGTKRVARTDREVFNETKSLWFTMFTAKIIFWTLCLPHTAYSVNLFQMTHCRIIYKATQWNAPVQSNAELPPMRNASIKQFSFFVVQRICLASGKIEQRQLPVTPEDLKSFNSFLQFVNKRILSQYVQMKEKISTASSLHSNQRFTICTVINGNCFVEDLNH